MQSGFGYFMKYSHGGLAVRNGDRRPAFREVSSRHREFSTPLVPTRLPAHLRFRRRAALGQRTERPCCDTAGIAPPTMSQNARHTRTMKHARNRAAVHVAKGSRASPAPPPQRPPLKRDRLPSRPATPNPPVARRAPRANGRDSAGHREPVLRMRGIALSRPLKPARRPLATGGRLGDQTQWTGCRRKFLVVVETELLRRLALVLSERQAVARIGSRPHLPSSRLGPGREGVEIALR
jgi:hypothetical protein